MSNRSGFRGYIGSRALRGTSYPQRLQNLVVRDYAMAHRLSYRLSASEYAMPGCYMILEDVLTQLHQLEGLILFSAFLLPTRRERRAMIYGRVLAAGASLHVALEQLVIRESADVARFEQVIAVANALPNTPLGARYDKGGDSLTPTDAAFAAAVRSPQP